MEEHIRFKVKYRSKTYVLEMSAKSPLNEIFVFLGEIIDFNHLNCKLIISGKSFSPDDVSEIGSVLHFDSTVLLLASSAEEIEKVKNFKPDPLVKGFEREILDEQKRAETTKKLAEANPWGESIKQDLEYRFTRIEVLFRRTLPTPFEAEKLLEKLTIDPGIIDIMKNRRWTVGTLCEIDPEDADLEQAAKGEGDKCLLGWNRNFGQRIGLRLRTDDFKGFRNYQSLINTLLHELTHNVYGPHDDKFWQLFSQLKEQYADVHSKRKSAHVLAGAPMAPPRTEKVMPTDQTRTRLGGVSAAKGIDAVRAARLKALDK